MAEGPPLPPVTIEDLNLSMRAYNVLKRESITRVEQLIALKEDDLLVMRGCNARAIEDIKAALHVHGLSLDTEWAHFVPGEVAVENIEVFRCDGVTLTVYGDGSAVLSHAKFTSTEREALFKIVDQYRGEDRN